MIYAFEPSTDSFKHLARLTSGHESKVKIFQLGLSYREQVAEMQGSNGGASFVYQKPPNEIMTRLVPFDSLRFDPSPNAPICDREGIWRSKRFLQSTIKAFVNPMLDQIHALREVIPNLRPSTHFKSQVFKKLQRRLQDGTQK